MSPANPGATPPSPDPFRRINDFLDQISSRDAGRRRVQAVLVTTTVLTAIPVLVVFLDALLHLPEWARTLMMGGYLIAGIVVFSVSLLHAILSPDRQSLALRVERRGGLRFENTLITAVELGQGGQLAGISGDLIRASAEQAADRLEGVNATILWDPRATQRWAAATAVSVSCFCLMILTGPGRITHRFLSLGRPLTPGSLMIMVDPGSRRVLAGSRLDVSVRLDGNVLVEKVLIRRWMAGSSQQEEVFELARGESPDSAYGLYFPAVTDDFQYRVEAGLFESPLYRIEVVSPPQIKTLALTYKRPEYTRLDAQVQRDPPYDLTALRGTKVTFELTASKPIQKCWLSLSNGTEVPLEGGAIPGLFTNFLVISSSGSYRIHLKDRDGFENPNPPRYQINAIQDRVPEVVILEPGKDLSVKASELTTLPLRIYAEDDYGLDSLTLMIRFRQRSDFSYEESESSEEIPLAQPGATKVNPTFVWDLTAKIFQPGDSISYWAQARDRVESSDPDNPRVGLSKTYRIEIPMADDLSSEVSAEQKEEISSLEDIISRQREVEKRLGKVLKDANRSQNINYKERKELEQLVTKQKEIKQRAEELAKQMQSTFDMLRKHDLMDPGTLQKLGEVQKLFAEVANSRMKEMMNRMRDLMQGMQMDPEKMKSMAQDFDKAKYSKELDRILEGLKQLKQKQELERLARAAKTMAEEQEKLLNETAERMQDGRPTEDLAQKQEELQQSADKLMKEMEEQAKDMSDNQPELADSLEKLATETKQEKLSEDLQESAKSLSKNQPEPSYARQTDALQKMRKVQDQLDQMKEQMEQKSVQLDIQAVRRLLSLGLDISAAQESVLVEAQFGSSVEDPRKVSLALAGKQYAALRGSIRFETRFEQAFQDDVMFKSTFLEHISQMVEDMGEAKTSFEESRIFSAKQLAGQNLGRLNVMLLKLTELMNHLQNQQQSQGMQNFFDQMEKMIHRQRQVNQNTQKLQPKPGEMDMFRQMMMQQALEQQMIRESMERLAKKYNKASNLLGDMDQLSEAMKEVEDSLGKFDNSDQTQEKQAGVLTRMLELETSVNKQGRSQKRRAEAAKEYLPRNVPSVTTDLQEARQILFENVTRGGYPPGFRSVVERYFSSFEAR